MATSEYFVTPANIDTFLRLNHFRGITKRVARFTRGTLRAGKTFHADNGTRERHQFQSILMRHMVAYSGHLDQQENGTLAFIEDDVWKPLHGMTADQIRDKVIAEEQEYGPANEEWEKAIQEGKVKRRKAVSGSPVSRSRRNRSRLACRPPVPYTPPMFHLVLPLAADYPACVVDVPDGDTLTVLRADKTQTRIRLHGIVASIVS